MNVEGVEKKLREARFFLDRMSEHERMPFDNSYTTSRAMI